MPKQRAPISTRLRNKDKNGTVIKTIQDTPLVESVKKESSDTTITSLLDDNTIFSPRVDTDIYLDELQSPLSFVRGTEEEKAQFLKDEDEVMSQSFGSDYKSSLSTSSFYFARISAPVPSKRTKDHKILLPANKRPSLIRESMDKIKIPFPMPSQKNKSRSLSPPKKSSTLASPSKCNLTPKTKKTVLSAAPITPRPLSNTNKQNVGHEKQQVENSPVVPLPQCKKLPVYIKMDAKDKEREYWRRQRRVFVHSRFLTNEEGVIVAKTVYSNLSINPNNRMVISMQGNIANFRTKLRRIFVSEAKRFNISIDYISNTKEDQLIHELTLKMNDSVLRSIWEHWIADPFVDANEFYQDKVSVNLLRNITVKLMIIHFKEQFSLLSPKQARAEMRKLDLISRTIPLPESSEFK